MKFQKDNITIEVELEDITEVSVDAIVNPANTKLLMGGGVAGAIRREGGEEIEREALKHAPVPIGEAVVTSAGRLKCKYVIHAPTVEEPASPSSFDNVYKATRAALRKVKELNLKSIAFPLMGAGVGGLAPEESIEAMTRAIEEEKLNINIKIIIRDEDTLSKVISKLESLSWRRKIE